MSKLNIKRGCLRCCGRFIVHWAVFCCHRQAICQQEFRFLCNCEISWPCVSRLLSSWMCCHIQFKQYTDVSEGQAAFLSGLLLKDHIARNVWIFAVDELDEVAISYVKAEHPHTHLHTHTDVPWSCPYCWLCRCLQRVTNRCTTYSILNCI